MFISISILFIIYNWLIIFKQCHGNASSNIFELDVEDFKAYIKEIKEDANLNVNPCNDFQKYACGNISSISEKTSYRHSYFNYNVRNYLIKPKTELEKSILKYYKKCSENFNKPNSEIVKDIFEKVDIFVEAESLPTKKEYSTKEIIKLATKLFPFGNKNLIYFERKLTLDENDDTHIINLESANYRLRFDKKYFHFVSKISGSKENDIQAALREIETFIKKMNKIYETNPSRNPKELPEKSFLNSFDELEKVLPSKNWDWNEFSKSVKRVLNPKLKYKIIVDITLLKDVLDLIDSTDPKVLANFLLLDQLAYLGIIECSGSGRYFLFAVIAHVWNEYFTNKVTHHYTNFLDKFELQFNKTTINEGNSDDSKFYKSKNTSNSIIYDIIKSYRHIVENHRQIYSPEILTNLYDNFDFDTSNICQNLLNSISNIFEIMWKNGAYELESNNNYNNIFYGQQHDGKFNYNDGSKPIFYYDAVLNYKFWLMYYESNHYGSYKIQENRNNNCVKKFEFTSNTNEIYQKEIFNFLRALKSSYDNVEFDKYATQMQNIGESAAWANPNKLFFISIAQRNCNYKDFFKALKYSNEFVNSFECSDGANTKFNEFIKC